MKKSTGVWMRPSGTNFFQRFAFKMSSGNGGVKAVEKLLEADVI